MLSANVLPSCISSRQCPTISSVCCPQFLLDFVLSVCLWAVDNCLHASTMSTSGMKNHRTFMNTK